MTLIIELTPEMQTQIEEEAAQRGQGVADYAREELQNLLKRRSHKTTQTVTKNGVRVMPTDYDRLTKIINENQMDAGIEDLAHQHEHHLYGTPKQ